MTVRLALSLAASLSLAAPALAADPAAPAPAASKAPKAPARAKAAAVAPTANCTGKLSGAVQGTFTCRMDAQVRQSGSLRILITPVKLPKNVKAFSPADLDVPGPVKPKGYPLHAMNSGASMLAAASPHVTFVADKKTEKKGGGLRGDATLTLTKVEGMVAHETPSVAGTLHARLVPSTPDGKGEVIVDITF